MKLRTCILFVFCFLLVASPFADAYSPWGGGGNASVYTGGGSQQGIPSTYIPQTFGTGTAWQATFNAGQRSVFVPTGTGAHLATGWWYTNASACLTGSTEPAWPSGYGASVTDGTCVWVATGPTQPVPSTWQVGLDFDFTAPGAQSFTTDGTFTFGGLTWTKINSVNEVTHASAGGGTGLALAPAASVWDQLTMTAPGVFLNFSQVNIPGLDWRTKFRVWVQIAALNTNSTSLYGGDSLTIAVANRNEITAPGNYLFYTDAFGYVAGSHILTFDGVSIVATNVGGSVTGTPTQAVFQPLVGMLEVNDGLLGGHCESFVKVNATTWPSYASMNPVLTTDLSFGNDRERGERGVNGTSNAIAASVGDWGVLIAAQKSSACTVTINRLRIDYLPQE